MNAKKCQDEMRVQDIREFFKLGGYRHEGVGD